MIKVCPVCGKEFETQHKNQICCSHKCSGLRSRKRTTKICPVCKKEFETLNHHSHINKGCCSKECKIVFLREKKHNYVVCGEIVKFNVFYKNTEYTCFIDKKDLDIVKKYSWYVRPATKDRVANYLCSDSNGERVLLHRLIMNCPKDMVIDHINHNGLDNRRCNLKIATYKENSLNRIKTKANRSGYAGIAQRKNGNWIVCITENYQRKYLGTYKTFEEALAVRKRAEKEVGIFYG